MSDRWPGGLIRSTPVTPAGPFSEGAAPGVWTLADAAYWVKQGLWPTPGKLAVEDVFSTWLYTGNGATQTITNGINLSGQGGLVWIKNRATAADHLLYDTVRGANRRLASNTTAGTIVEANQLNSFNSNGFALGTDGALNAPNRNAEYYTSWTFREAPKFFDVVTYTGNGVAGRTVPHNLGIAPGCMLVKNVAGTSASTADWAVYHISTGATQQLILNSTAVAAVSSQHWNNTAPTATDFTVGTSLRTNENGSTYIAYLFAHDDTSTGIIECGSYTGNGLAAGPTISLGWEPQWLLIKQSAGATGGWLLFDNIRGMPVGYTDALLKADTTGAEAALDYISPTSTGFQVVSANTDVNQSGGTYIYIAIRGGQMRTPTVGTSVFQPVAYTATNVDNRLVDTGIVTDMVMARARAVTSSGGFYVADRLRGIASLGTAVALAEDVDPDSYMTPTSGYGNAFSTMVGFGVGNDSIRQLNYLTNTEIAYAFRRAAGFMDIVCYTGGGATTSVYNHNLGVVPELIIIKSRSNGVNVTYWPVKMKSVLGQKALALNSGSENPISSTYWAAADDTATQFNTRASATAYDVNATGYTYVAYLFASAPGVSKVGSYTGNGSSQTIDCSFAAGARFVMIKRTDTAGDWYVWDTARGIVAGNDLYLTLNGTGGEVSLYDSVDTTNIGFVVNQLSPTNVNVLNATYIFLAIA